MNQPLTVKDALHIAISEEIKAYNIYQTTSAKVTGAGAKKMLLELASQEKGHQQFLELLVQQDNVKQLGESVPTHNPGIADFLTPAKSLEPNASIQDVMIFAMNEEKKAAAFYTDMQHQFAGTDAERIFKRLAAEERGHKIRLEEEYENIFYREN
jgi:rubrerythrin